VLPWPVELLRITASFEDTLTDRFAASREQNNKTGIF
jgi:hypothetical protein